MITPKTAIAKDGRVLPVLEKDYSEDEYQEFLDQVSRFDKLVAQGKREDAEKQAAKQARKK